MAARKAGFSLVEVVIAIGVFAAAIIAVVGLLGPSLRSTRDALDTTVAARLAETVEGALKQLPFQTVADATDQNGEELLAAASADGSQAFELSTPEAEFPSARRYFLIRIRKLAAPPRSRAVLPLQVVVEWPYILPDGTESPAGTRSVFGFNLALLR